MTQDISTRSNDCSFRSEGWRLVHISRFLLVTHSETWFLRNQTNEENNDNHSVLYCIVNLNMPR
uniref:Uncharacterized protein n=1 Tax=Anopheles atroparvus TaxID=41427 RepID=A0AAG5DRK1_ANOAO